MLLKTWNLVPDGEWKHCGDVNLYVSGLNDYFFLICLSTNLLCVWNKRLVDWVTKCFMIKSCVWQWNIQYCWLYLQGLHHGVYTVCYLLASIWIYIFFKYLIYFFFYYGNRQSEMSRERRYQICNTTNIPSVLLTLNPNLLGALPTHKRNTTIFENDIMWL